MYMYRFIIKASVFLIASLSVAVGQQPSPSADRPACTYADLPISDTLRGIVPPWAIERMEAPFQNTVGSELGKRLGDTAILSDANVIRYGQAVGMLSELLAGFLPSSSATASLSWVVDELKREGPVKALVIPLAALSEGSGQLGRTDAVAVSLKALSFINPTLTNHLCAALAIPMFELEKIPTGRGGLEGSVLGSAAAAKSFMNDRPLKFPATKIGRSVNIAEATVSFAKSTTPATSKTQLDSSPSNRANDAQQRMECRLACVETSSWEAAGIVAKEMIKNAIPDIMNNVGKFDNDGKPIATPIDSLIITAEKANKKADQITDPKEKKCDAECQDPDKAPKQKTTEDKKDDNNKKKEDEKKAPVPPLAANDSKRMQDAEPKKLSTEEAAEKEKNCKKNPSSLVLPNGRCIPQTDLATRQRAISEMCEALSSCSKEPHRVNTDERLKLNDRKSQLAAIGTEFSRGHEGWMRSIAELDQDTKDKFRRILADPTVRTNVPRNILDRFNQDLSAK